MAASLSLLHDDGDLIVVDKPAGLRSTRERDTDEDNVEAALAAQLGRRRLWAVHQLDRDTTGPLLLVTRKALVAAWQKKLAAGSKRYLALVHGVMAGDPRTIDAALRRDRDAGRTVVDDSGKPATTRVKVVAHGEEASAVICLPQQGRTHQIRAHLAHVGHPLLGDSRYGAPPSSMLSRHALHLWQLKVAGSVFVAPVPDDMRSAAAALVLSLPDPPPR